MKLIHQKNLFLFALTIFIFTGNIHCMQKAIPAIIIKKRTHQDIKANSFSEESSSEDSSAKDSPVKEPLRKKQKINTSEEKEDLCYQEKNNATTKPYKCDCCDKTFKYNSQLQKHKNVHENDRPFQCEKCNSTFKYKNNLQNHKIVHSNKKSFPCNYKNCNKSFKRKGDLQRHINVHTNKTVYPCKNKKCNKTYTTKMGLIFHTQRIHENIRYSCSQCNNTYTSKENLKKHIEKQHPKSTTTGKS